MKKKVGTILDEDLLLAAKRRALSEKRSFNQLFEEALKRYLDSFKKKDNDSSVSKSSKGSMGISLDDLKQVMEEESSLET